MEYKQNHKNNPLSNSITSCTLNDKENYIEVGIKALTNRKIDEFKQTITSSNAIVFINKTKFSEYCSEENNSTTFSTISPDAIKAGIPIEINGTTKISLGFPVYRDISSGRQYGFVTCGHSLNVNDLINTTIPYQQPLGVIRLQRLGGAYDVSFISLNSGKTGSNAINNTLLYLTPSNEEINHPIVGKTVYLNTRSKTNTSGVITSTNWSGYTDGVFFEHLTKLSSHVKQGDSGGLVSSQSPGPHINERIQEGIVSQKDEDNCALICSAYDIVNLWYLTCY